MTPQTAVAVAHALIAAAETAEALGRQQIAVDDLERAVALDDAARAELVAAIAAAEGKGVA